MEAEIGNATPDDGGLGVCCRLRGARPGGRPQSCTAARRQGRVYMTMKDPPQRCGGARRAQQQVRSARTPCAPQRRVCMHLSSECASRGAATHYLQYLHTRAVLYIVTHTILHPVARARRAPSSFSVSMAVTRPLSPPVSFARAVHLSSTGSIGRDGGHPAFAPARRVRRAVFVLQGRHSQRGARRRRCAGMPQDAASTVLGRTTNSTGSARQQRQVSSTTDRQRCSPPPQSAASARA